MNVYSLNASAPIVEPIFYTGQNYYAIPILSIPTPFCSDWSINSVVLFHSCIYITIIPYEFALVVNSLI